MISLTYLSTAVDPFSEEQLHRLLGQSRGHNAASGVTGMLLYVDGHFIQTLEGDQAVVDAAFARITADVRHRDVFITWREEIDERRFPDWSMGFEALDGETAEQLPGLNDFLTAKDQLDRTAQHLGAPGVFHRIFRDHMR